MYGRRSNLINLVIVTGGLLQHPARSFGVPHCAVSKGSFLNENEVFPQPAEFGRRVAPFHMAAHELRRYNAGLIPMSSRRNAQEL